MSTASPFGDFSDHPRTAIRPFFPVYSFAACTQTCFRSGADLRAMSFFSESVVAD